MTNSDETPDADPNVTQMDHANAEKRSKPRAPRAHKPDVAPRRGKSAKKAAAAKKAPKGDKQPAAIPRPGSKTAEVISLLEKTKGATLAELMKTTG